MPDEIYPPPRPAPRPQPDDMPPGPQSAVKRRRLYMLLSMALALLAFALNFSNNTNLISFKAQPSELPHGTVEITVRLKNNSLMQLYCSRHYEIERLQDGEWVKWSENGSDFEPPYFTVGRFGKIDLTFGKLGVTEPLAPGEYRIALGVYTGGSLLGTSHSRTLYAEFTVSLPG